MTGYLLLLNIAVLVSKVHSQLCSPPILPPPCQPTIPPCSVTSPQVVNPNPYVTTIIDNSVSNALANALQLLIVSNLIGATIGPSAPLVPSLGPLLESLICPYPSPVEIPAPEYVICGPTYEFIPPCSPIQTCSPYYETIPSYPVVPCGPIYDAIPPCVPITTCTPNYEIIPSCGSIIEPYPPPLCGLTEILSPNYITYTETISPICIESFPFNGYCETLLPVYGIETITPNYCGGLTEVVSNYINYPCPEICPSPNPFYGGLIETTPIIAPCLPPVANIYASELSPFATLAAVAPNYFGGLAELSVPLAGDVLLPSPISAPLPCNFGYTPSSLPCVRVNMEPLVYDNCLYNGFGGPIYY